MKQASAALRGVMVAGILGLPWAAAAQAGPGAPATYQYTGTDRYFTASDGTRLHFIDSGRGPTLVFVPGWTMPGWIFVPQLAAFSPAYHVVAFDPRGQGSSDIPATGYEPVRRGQDIADLLAQLGKQPVVLVGWSLGVLDVLAYLHAHGDAAVAGLVLIDNSVGEEPAPVASPRPPRRVKPPPYPVFMSSFVRSMFKRPEPENYLETLTDAALRMPQSDSAKLLNYPVPRTFWREAIYATTKPVLYVVRPGFSGQAGNLQRNRPNTETVVFTDAGHALFVDEAARFNALMGDFIRRRVWP